MDTAAAVIKSIDEPRSNSEIINIGSGAGTSVIEIAEFLRRAYNSESRINVTGDFRIGDIAHNIADISKAKDILGFEQSISLEQGLRQFCDWVKGQSVDNSGYEKSLKEMEDSGMFVRKI